MKALMNRTIREIRQELEKRNRVTPLTVADMEELLAIELANKNRSGIREWLQFGIKIGTLPKDYLGYHDRVSCFKSALQKYLRRSQTEKALRAASSLWRLDKASAVKRIKIIIPEESHCAIGLLNYIDDGMDESQFLGIVHALSEAPKDKSSCPLACRMAETKVVDNFSPDINFIKENLLDRSQLSILAQHVFALCRINRLELVLELLGGDKVVRELLNRHKAGTYWADDSTLLIVSAVRYAQGDYDKSIVPNEVSLETIIPLGLHEIDWYCLDFHTPIGRAAERIFLARHRAIGQEQLRNAWFMNEGAKVEGQIIQGEFEAQSRDQTFWSHYGGEIKALVEDSMKRFKLTEYQAKEGNFGASKCQNQTLF